MIDANPFEECGDVPKKTGVPKKKIDEGNPFDDPAGGGGAAPKKDDEENITVDWGGLGVTDVFTGFMLGYDITGVEPSGLITASVTVKLTSYVSGNLFDT